MGDLDSPPGTLHCVSKSTPNFCSNLFEQSLSHFNSLRFGTCCLEHTQLSWFIYSTHLIGALALPDTKQKHDNRMFKLKCRASALLFVKLHYETTALSGFACNLAGVAKVIVQLLLF